MRITKNDMGYKILSCYDMVKVNMTTHRTEVI